MKSTNSVTLVTGNHRHPVYWDLFNNVIPHVAENRGQNLISSICDGANGKRVTEKMANPGSKRKQIDQAKLETDPKTVHNQFKKRKTFIAKGHLADLIYNELNFNL